MLHRPEYLVDIVVLHLLHLPEMIHCCVEFDRVHFFPVELMRSQLVLSLLVQCLQHHLLVLLN